MRMFNRWLLAVIVLFGLGLNACRVQEAAVNSKEGMHLPEQENQSGPEPGTATGEAARQPVEIQTADGRLLEGFYYPPRLPDAPVIVLMHWAPGSMEDWEHIAVWLQNLPEDSPSPSGGKHAYQDATWFPKMPEEISFAVLIFNFGDYGSSQYGGSRESLVEDARAALQRAASFMETNPHQVAAIGASIGADGVVDGCYLLNDAGEKGTCVGAFSLSPGNYLTNEFSYSLAAEMINRSGYPVWCLAAEGDGGSPELCQSLSGSANQAFIYPGRAHGMDLIDSERFPSSPAVNLNVLELMQEFLEQVYGISLNETDLP